MYQVSVLSHGCNLHQSKNKPSNPASLYMCHFFSVCHSFISISALVRDPGSKYLRHYTSEKLGSQAGTVLRCDYFRILFRKSEFQKLKDHYSGSIKPIKMFYVVKSWLSQSNYLHFINKIKCFYISITALTHALIHKDTYMCT